jgi:signal transduction histidine kinase
MQCLGLRDLIDRTPGECLVFTLRAADLESIAWREGREQALSREREAAFVFRDLCARTLRAGSAFGHEAESNRFVAAMPAPPHDLPRVARAVLAELAYRMYEATGLRVEGGWALCERGSDAGRALGDAMEAALGRGRRERERCAFFASIGHEMRTPLMSIDGYLQTVLESDLDESTRRHFTEVAKSESTRLRRLVESMYALSLADLDTELKRRVSCDVQSAVERAAEAIYPVAARRRTRLKVCSRVRCAIPLAAEHAVALFVNLLENAVKHGSECGRIEIYLEERGDLTVYVDDDGPGVPEADRARIFKELERGNASAPGDGLGLSIVRATIERVGGHVGVTTSPLGGARFALRIPLAEEAEFHSGITMRSP